MTVVNPPPNLIDKEKRVVVTYLLTISQDQSIENNTRIILNHILKGWDGNKSSAHPSAHVITPADVLSMKLYSIELKYY